MDTATLENWHAAGQIAGRGYADEMHKLGQIWLIDQVLQEPGIDKEAFLRQALPGLGKMLTSGPAKAIGVGALAAGGAGGAHIITKKVEEGQQQEELAAIAPQIFRAGFVQGARQGFMQGARRGYQEATGERGK